MVNVDKKVLYVLIAIAAAIIAVAVGCLMLMS